MTRPARRIGRRACVSRVRAAPFSSRRRSFPAFRSARPSPTVATLASSCRCTWDTEFGGEFEQQNGSTKYELDEGNSAGLIFNIVARDVNTQWQLLYGQQSTNLKTPLTFDPSARLGMDVEYFQFGGTYLFDGDDMRPFVALTAGVTHFGPTLPGVDS